ncbi:MAG: thioredoxin family protein [Clostridia bacterium]|nr:thioredoxin family protein [Deltaproteobacteria bacterium]
MARFLLASQPALAASSGDAPIGERLAELLNELLTGDRVGLAISVCWLGGLLTAGTPCVYPLYPVTIRYFSGGNPARPASDKRVFSYAATYIAGMTLLYATLGTAFSALGIVFGSTLSSPWVTGAMAFMAFAMAISLLGAFTLRLPTGLATHLGMLGSRSYGGAFVMGLASGLVAAPCTGPVLTVILTLIARTKQLGLGFGLMVAFGLGVGAPLLVVAAYSHRLNELPRSGPWMSGVKVVLASAMILVGAYFAAIASHAIERGLSGLPIWLAAVFALAGVAAFVAVIKTKAHLAQGAAVLGFGGALVIAALGAHAAQTIAWQHIHEAGLAKARADGKAVMIDFTADWCTGCKELDAQTFVDPRVTAEAERFVALKLDATDPDDAMHALFAQYSVYGLPTVVFITAAGQVLDNPRVTGFTPPERFVSLMREVP